MEDRAHSVYNIVTQEYVKYGQTRGAIKYSTSKPVAFLGHAEGATTDAVTDELPDQSTHLSSGHRGHSFSKRSLQVARSRSTVVAKAANVFTPAKSLHTCTVGNSSISCETCR